MQRIPTTLTQTEIKQFERDGFVVVKGAFAREDADAMQDEWWRELSEVHGIRRDEPSTWKQPPSDVRGGKVSPLQKKIQTERVRGVLNDLLGEGAWKWPKHWGRAIATFPVAKAWDVPSHLWHSDSAYPWHRGETNAAFTFVFIAPVAPESGGTLIVTGSHRLMRTWEDELLRGPRGKDGTAQRERFNQAHPWLAALTGAAPSPADRRAAFMMEGVEIDGIGLRVVELTGEPGDIVFCHPMILHCAAPNSGTWPRMMRIAMLPTDAMKRLRNS